MPGDRNVLVARLGEDHVRSLTRSLRPSFAPEPVHNLTRRHVAFLAATSRAVGSARCLTSGSAFRF
jgi:hypothetical protein